MLQAILLLLTSVFMSILAAERQQQILKQLGRDGRVLAGALAEAFSTSEDTIRRDLRDLAGRGLCRRVYGGALPVSPASSPAPVRAGEATDRKAALGQALAALVAPGSLVFVDSGWTNLAAVKAFPDDLRLTVATHDPAIAAVLLAKPEVTLWLIGGRVDREIGAALGGRTLLDIEALRPELALLGVCALDPVAGAAAFDPEDAEIKRALLRNSGRVAAAILNEKLETSAPFAIGSAESLDRLVLEADAPEPVARAFADRGIAVVRAQPPRAG
ncbi:MAG TPA: DeoR/GlpR family DNA-binding transcription regulator [Roseiarcus sp.]|jgi:DeoR/GlpR family transcriptional regulator of sugar metabolism